MNEILKLFPKESLPLVRKLLERPLLSKPELLSKLQSYNAIIDTAAKSRPDLDVNLAECISRACVSLIEESWENDVQSNMLIQVACDYFITEEDEEGDLNSVFGFDDDVKVVNAIALYLDREDLQILG